MKYEIDRFNNNEVIKYYYKSDNSILVVYLDNHTKEIPYTEDNEKKVLNEMIMQALAREEIELNSLPIKLKYDLLSIISRISISYLMFNSVYINKYYYVDKSIIYKLIYSVILSICSVNIFKYIYVLINDYRKCLDIIKYHEFFELQEELDKYGETIIKDNLRLKDIININTLDNYSIANIEELLNMAEKKEHNKVLSL